MKIKMTYVAKDGVEFANVEDCQDYERGLDLLDMPVIKNRISGVENYEGYWAELYLIKSRKDYEIVLSYLGRKRKSEHLTTNFNVDNFGWFIHWSELNEDGSTESFLLNYKYYFRSLYDNLMLFDEQIQDAISIRGRAGEHAASEEAPKPQYPTWKEWKNENFLNASTITTPYTSTTTSELGCTATNCSVCKSHSIPLKEGVNMKAANDLISRSALLEAIRGDHPPFYDGQDVANWQEKCINEAPAVDAEPMRHGKWLFSDYDYFTCSVCGGQYFTGADSTKDAKAMLENNDYYPYCPHCGARMDGV